MSTVQKLFFMITVKRLTFLALYNNFSLLLLLKSFPLAEKICNHVGHLLVCSVHITFMQTPTCDTVSTPSGMCQCCMGLYVYDDRCIGVSSCVTAELKKWDLVLRGTASHPQAHNITPPANHDQPFTCSGITSHGVCIGQSQQPR